MKSVVFFFCRFQSIVAYEKKQSAAHVGDGYDNILQLKKKCMFPFFHGSRFPGQGALHEKCFIFKMSTKGRGSGVDLVNKMRRTGTGYLKHSWVHFDYTHRVAGWATMSCSVYDPRYLWQCVILHLNDDTCYYFILIGCYCLV